MGWVEISPILEEGEYIVKTKTMFGWNVMKATLHLDIKGKQSWSVRNQEVTHYLEEIDKHKNELK